MNLFIKRFIKLNFGLFLCALGISITISAQIGYSPWEVFHAGLANTIHIEIGTASILVGLIIGILSLALGEKIGIGTISNMILIGLMMNVILGANILPTSENLFVGILLLLFGIAIFSIGSYFYIGSGFGAGPRDSLMIALTRITKLPIGICRSSVELAAVLIGWRLGGLIGLGTVISVFGIGFLVHTTFHLLHFDPTTIDHENLQDTFLMLFSQET
jgi:uncharacterized membrane protein YczE